MKRTANSPGIAALAPGQGTGPHGYTLAEVLVSVMLLGVLSVSLFAAFSSGMGLVQLARENLRATQILAEKMDSVRLLTWDQGSNPSVAAPTFQAWYDPASTNGGVLYQGTVRVDPAPDGTPADYAGDLRLLTVTVYWTNGMPGTTNTTVRSRQMQTAVARYGLQNYRYR